MSVKIRLTQSGKKNQIQYRIVSQDTHTKRDGKFLEILGHFNPNLPKETGLKLDKDAYEKWVKLGAKPTPSVQYVLENGKLPKKVRVKKVEEPAQKPAEPKVETPAAQTEEAPKEEVKEEAAPAEELKAEQAAEETPAVEVSEKPEDKPVEEKPIETQAEPKTEETN